MAHSRRKELLEKERDLQAQRRSARKARRKAKYEPSPEVQMDMTPKLQRFTTDAETFHELQLAWKALDRSDTLTTYERKYRYDEAKQKATAEGTFEVTLPFELIRRIQKELHPHWRFASLEDREG